MATKTSLDVLADAAVAKCSSEARSYYDSHDHVQASPRSSSCSSECTPMSPKSPSPGGVHHLRSRKPAHKRHKASLLHITPKPELKTRRKELLARACAIESLENSPVNAQQLFVLRTVYDEITMYPIEPWLVLMAIVLHRSQRQIKNWFSNERQKNRCGETVCAQNELGERLRLRPSALEFCEDWSDAFFEEVLMIVNFRTARRLQWEHTGQ
ncbi:hypothetical protein GGX14DRAFT_640325 [Mycena pura]|uniref:Homeobox domain-containing protein n=1 Tax=Mycena pura TaxID=153505 RepID=A0AAD6YQ88_9AGAR|nr:hypothetical protein GGX14DRAFT_640325 [Mycena pura]